MLLAALWVNDCHVLVASRRKCCRNHPGVVRRQCDSQCSIWSGRRSVSRAIQDDEPSRYTPLPWETRGLEVGHLWERSRCDRTDRWRPMRKAWYPGWIPRAWRSWGTDPGRFPVSHVSTSSSFSYQDCSNLLLTGRRKPGKLLLGPMVVPTEARGSHQQLFIH